MRQKSRLIIVVMMLFFIAGCFGTQVREDPVDLLVASKVAYVEALQIYYNSATSYKMWFEAAPPETQEKWREEFHPLFKEAKSILDMWTMFIDEGELPDDATIDDWKRVKTKLLIKLYDSGVVKSE